MKPSVEAAIAALRECYADRVNALPLPDGGAKVIVTENELNDTLYLQKSTWIGFTITFLHPYADIYPHFVRPDLGRKDGAPFGQAIHVNRDFYGQPATMISRKTRVCSSDHPMNAQLKLEKVLQWLNSQ